MKRGNQARSQNYDSLLPVAVSGRGYRSRRGPPFFSAPPRFQGNNGNGGTSNGFATNNTCGSVMSSTQAGAIPARNPGPPSGSPPTQQDFPGFSGRHFIDPFVVYSFRVNHRNRAFPHLTYYPEEEVAIYDSHASIRNHQTEIRALPPVTQRASELPFGAYMLDESAIFDPLTLNGQHTRHTRGRRIHYSYEELLALGEHIGSVSTGLTEEAILGQLKTSAFMPYASGMNSEEDLSGFCVICQGVFEDEESIATLGCRHQYHADCLKKWLLEKNLCPICKSTALTMSQKEGT